MTEAKRNYDMRCIYPNCWGDTGTMRTFFCDKHEAYRAIERDLFIRVDGDPRELYQPLTAVYVIGSTEIGAIKIGIAGDVLDRMATLQTGFPLPLKLFSATYTSRAFAARLERKCHEVLTEFDLHLNGEWFEVNVNDACDLVVKCAEILEIPVLNASQYWTMMSLADEIVTGFGLADDHMLTRVLNRIRRDFVRDMLDTA